MLKSYVTISAPTQVHKRIYTSHNARLHRVYNNQCTNNACAPPTHTDLSSKAFIPLHLKCTSTTAARGATANLLLLINNYSLTLTCTCRLNGRSDRLSQRNDLL